MSSPLVSPVVRALARSAVASALFLAAVAPAQAASRLVTIVTTNVSATADTVKLQVNLTVPGGIYEVKVPSWGTAGKLQNTPKTLEHPSKPTTMFQPIHIKTSYHLSKTRLAAKVLTHTYTFAMPAKRNTYTGDIYVDGENRASYSVSIVDAGPSVALLGPTGERTITNLASATLNVRISDPDGIVLSSIQAGDFDLVAVRGSVKARVQLTLLSVTPSNESDRQADVSLGFEPVSGSSGSLDGEYYVEAKDRAFRDVLGNFNHEVRLAKVRLELLHTTGGSGSGGGFGGGGGG